HHRLGDLDDEEPITPPPLIPPPPPPSYDPTKRVNGESTSPPAFGTRPPISSHLFNGHCSSSSLASDLKDRRVASEALLNLKRSEIKAERKYESMGSPPELKIVIPDNADTKSESSVKSEDEEYIVKRDSDKDGASVS